MTDMLVKLYTLPNLEPILAQQQEVGVNIRRAMAAEKRLVADWVGQTFEPGWANECEIAFAHQPISCYIAVINGQLVGFACHDATCKNFFGPTGVSDTYRGRGVGKALLLACLHAMADHGYAYAIIGGVGPVEFYVDAVGAVEIEGSDPGVYEGMLNAK